MGNFIQMRKLGRKGRFGNQLFQYAFLRKIAEMNGCQIQTPSDWIGRKLFDAVKDDAACDSEMPTVGEADVLNKPLSNVDIEGYFQESKFTSLLSRTECRRLFTFNDKAQKGYERKQGFYVAAHLRRGDLLANMSHYYIVSRKSVVDAITARGYYLRDVVWVSDGNQTRVAFKETDFVNDFLTLQHAPVLFRSNSTFSWWAATLGEGKVYSPTIGVDSHGNSLKGMQDAAYVEGNHPHPCRPYLADLQIGD